MSFTKAGINLTGLNNITELNLTISSTPTNIMADITAVLTSSVGVYVSGIIYVGMLVMFFWTLSESSPFSTFKYSYLRALLLSVCLVNLISITQIEVGFTSSFRLVAVLVLVNALLGLIVLGLDNGQ